MRPGKVCVFCRFGFAETTVKEEIEKAVKALDSKEINGRRLRVRAAGDKEKKPGDPGYKEKEKDGECKIAFNSLELMSSGRI